MYLLIRSWLTKYFNSVVLDSEPSVNMIFERTLVHVGVSVQVAEKGQMGMDEAW